MKLTKRLDKIAKFVKEGAKIADIGTDHAYIPVYLAEKNIVSRAIACDVNEGPLNIAKKNIMENGLEHKIETRIGSGLKPLKMGEVDTAIIAGMGGLLISTILEESMEIAKSLDRLILQPMVAQEELRIWLNKNGFIIEKEGLVIDDGKMYEVIVTKKGFEEIEDSIYYDVGKRLIEDKDPLLKEFITNKIAKYEKLLYNLSKQKSFEEDEKYIIHKEKLKKLKGVLKCLGS
ncbi:MAG: class I SAM-dependent methyltransferase [Anaeromicrobium sp.]|jgi:tRNA (adenine22-N1)-methyltransferase|uniref:tRNA (adenine(22)-N(1))-methyltransferase n=1 Tax=Anaeromicrobium sp. TaxID=1929132 RepID=UPI0025D72D44|nr:class I SAM-dependent methyltransferase [Anaeromicrobium sp.]MCT4594573.1 class I SAM-dependent methyltransferase [Anaeromicrobium sp.]